MSYHNNCECNPCPPCESSIPLTCEPLPITAEAKRVVVEDVAGCKKTVQQPAIPSLLGYDITSQTIQWVDRSQVAGLPNGIGVFVSQVAGSPFWLNGNQGQFLKIGAGGILEFGSITTWVALNTNTVLAGSQFILADTSVAPFTLFLPATPSVADAIQVADHSGTWATNNLTINRNGQTIDGLAQDLICNISGKLFTLIFNGATWRIFTV
jgi:hypothetical protein